MPELDVKQLWEWEWLEEGDREQVTGDSKEGRGKREVNRLEVKVDRRRGVIYEN